MTPTEVALAGMLVTVLIAFCGALWKMSAVFASLTVRVEHFDATMNRFEGALLRFEDKLLDARERTANLEARITPDIQSGREL